MEVNGYQQLIGCQNPSKYIFCAQQKKETYTDLEQIEGEEKMTRFNCWVNYPFKIRRI